VIITRTPLRISIGGGGTDLPSYYREFGGFVISAAIDKYVYVSANRRFFPGYLLKYSEMEDVQRWEDISHKLIREVIQMHKVPAEIEIVSVADVPAGTGLGSSGTFLVGLLHAIHAYSRKPVDAETLAREAVDIEMNRLKEPVGKQDQYIAAYGGLLCQEYKTDDSVEVYPLEMTDTSIHELRDSLMLFFIGQTRDASSILVDQKVRSEQKDSKILEGLHFIKQLGREIKVVLESADILRFGKLMHEHWLYKRQRSKSISSNRIDELYELARSQGGATGGKLVGAGGSGFLLFHTQDRPRLRRAMSEVGLMEMDFSFDFDGSSVIARSH
jgi:D-glycero-alpha-D-manno-heptose-7-phosphate kinase